MIQAVALCEQAGTAVLRGFDLDEDSDESIAEQAPPTNRPAAHQPYSSTAHRPSPCQLRGALSASGARVIDLFREWDADGDGKVAAPPPPHAAGYTPCPSSTHTCR